MKIKVFISGIILLFSGIVLAQNRRFYHIIKESEVLAGRIPLVYNDGTNHVMYGPNADPSFTICSNLKAVVTLSGGVANVDIFSLVSSDNSPCINQHTPLGRFTLDIDRDSLGDHTYIYRIPFKLQTWSVATVPFRYRFKSGNSSSTVSTSLSASASYGWSIWGESVLTHRAINHYYIIAGPFLGITSVDLKKSTVEDPSSWIEDRTNIGLSYGGSLTFGRNNFGLVLSVGADHGFGENKDRWSYQDKIWVGIGINTSLGLF